MPPRNLIPQYQQPAALNSTSGDYSALAQLLADQQGGYHPVYSAGQGIADVIGKVGGAYFEKQAAEKAKKADTANYAALAESILRSGAPLARDQSSGMAYDTAAFPALNNALPESLQQHSQATPLTQDEKLRQGAMYLQQHASPKFAVDALPGYFEMAKQMQPPPVSWQDTEEGHTKTAIDPRTGLPKSGVAPLVGGVKQTDYERELAAQGVVRGSPDWNKKLAAHQTKQDYIPPEPLTAINDSNSPTGSRMVPRGQAEGQPGPGSPRPNNVQQENELRTQFNSLTAPYLQTKDAVGRVDALADNPSAKGDVGLLFAMMKVYDPNIRVNEGTAATVEDAQSVPQSILQKYNKALTGEGLSPEDRSDLKSQAHNILGVQNKNFDQIKKQYSDIATRNGLKPENVVHYLIENEAIKVPMSPDGTPDYSKLSDQQILALDAQRKKRLPAGGGVTK